MSIRLNLEKSMNRNREGSQLFLMYIFFKSVKNYDSTLFPKKLLLLFLIKLIVIVKILFTNG